MKHQKLSPGLQIPTRVFSTTSGHRIKRTDILHKWLEKAVETASVVRRNLPILQELAKQDAVRINKVARIAFASETPTEHIPEIISHISEELQATILEFGNQYAAAIQLPKQTPCLKTLQSSEKLQKLFSYLFCHSPETFLHHFEATAIMKEWSCAQDTFLEEDNLTTSTFMHDIGKTLLTPEALHFPVKLNYEQKFQNPMHKLRIPHLPPSLSKLSFHDYINRHPQLSSKIWITFKSDFQGVIDEASVNQYISSHHQQPGTNTLCPALQLIDIISAITQIRSYNNHEIRPSDSIERISQEFANNYQYTPPRTPISKFLKNSNSWNIIYASYALLSQANLDQDARQQIIPGSALTQTYNSY